MASQAQRQALVAIDASAQAYGVLGWALDHLLRDTDRLHVICVAEPPPPPVMHHRLRLAVHAGLALGHETSLHSEGLAEASQYVFVARSG